MKTVNILTICALLAFACNAIAADGLRIADFSIASGETKTVSVELVNADDSYIMLDFFLQLPDGITINKDENGDFVVVQNNSRFTKTHYIEVGEIENNVYRILIYSNRNSAIKGSSGELFSMTLSADANVVEGASQGRFYSQVFANKDEQEYNPADVSFTITVGSSVFVGDVNNDTQVDAKDVTALANYLVGRGTLANEAAAYVNDDDKIDIADLAALIELLK